MLKMKSINHFVSKIVLIDVAYFSGNSHEIIFSPTEDDNMAYSPPAAGRHPGKPGQVMTCKKNKQLKSKVV